jgi:deoxyadenosine/deoxycytidine kinase
MLADRNIFGMLMGDLSNSEPVETCIYRQITEHVVNQWPLAGIIYLKCKPETCFSRIKKRNRFE